MTRSQYQEISNALGCALIALRFGKIVEATEQVKAAAKALQDARIHKPGKAA